MSELTLLATQLLNQILKQNFCVLLTVIAVCIYVISVWK